MIVHDLNSGIPLEWDNRGLDETELTSGIQRYRIAIPFCLDLIINAFENAGYPADDYLVHTDAIRKLIEGEGRPEDPQDLL